MTPRAAFPRSVFTTGLLAAMLALGCSSSGSSAGTPASTCASFNSVEQACTGSFVNGSDLFTSQCVTALSLPGAPSTSAYAACASAVLQTGCADGLRIPECDLRGTLAAGADCNEDSQCASDACTIPTAATCGTCAAILADGQACPAGVGCRAGAACIAGTCTALTYGSVGATCDGLTALCASNLYCAATTGTNARTCEALPTSGAPCGRNGLLGVSADLCAPPYVCGASATCVTGGGAGDACPCGSGFVCEPSSDGGTATCVSATPAGPGEACGAAGCATGACNTASHTCPSVLADGQACTAGSATAVCDLASTCANGVCASVASTISVCK